MKRVILILFIFLLVINLVSAQEVSESDPCEGLTESQCKAAQIWVKSLTPSIITSDKGEREYYPNELIVLSDATSPEDLVRAKEQIERDFTYAIDLLEDYKGNLEDAQIRGLFGKTNQLFPDYNEIISEIDSKVSFFNNLKDQIPSQNTGSELRDLRASARDEWMELILIERYAVLRLQPARLIAGAGYSIDEVLTGNIHYLTHHFNNYPNWIEFKARASNDQDIYDPDESGFVQSWIDSDNEWSTFMA